MILLRTRLFFLLMHCVLFAANELNNAPNSSRRVGGKVAFFPGASTDDVWLAPCFPTARYNILSNGLHQIQDFVP